MENSATPGHEWTESDSQRFIDLGEIYTPERRQIAEVILDLIPKEVHEPFLAVDVGMGAGWLAEAILTRYPASQVVGLDGSMTMLREADRKLQRFKGRYDLRHFQLQEPDWLAEIRDTVHCFVSSLVIHHLDGAEKAALYTSLHQRLADSGALLVADLVAPSSTWEQRYLARAWDAVVKEQSQAILGSPAAYQHFVEDHWNWFQYPDPMDQPSTISQHLQWLSTAGFVGANVFWEMAGHAVYGGYKSQAYKDHTNPQLPRTIPSVTQE